MKKNKTYLTFAVSICLLVSGCNSLTAYSDLEKISAQASQQFPVVAAIPYTSCVNQEKNNQLKRVTAFKRDFDFNQSEIDKKCATFKATEERLEKMYGVLFAYIETLGKLASNDVATFDKSIPSAIPGLNDAQSKAVSGLAGVIADAFTNRWRQRELSKAIEQGQPHVQVLIAAFNENLNSLLQQFKSNETDSLESLYREANAQTPNPILITKLYKSDLEAINSEEQALQAFIEIFNKLGYAHTQLYNNRGKLFTKDTVQQLFQTLSDIKKQVDAVQKAFS